MAPTGAPSRRMLREGSCRLTPHVTEGRGWSQASDACAVCGSLLGAATRIPAPVAADSFYDTSGGRPDKSVCTRSGLLLGAASWLLMSSIDGKANVTASDTASSLGSMLDPILDDRHAAGQSRPGGGSPAPSAQGPVIPCLFMTCGAMCDAAGTISSR